MVIFMWNSDGHEQAFRIESFRFNGRLLKYVVRGGSQETLVHDGFTAQIYDAGIVLAEYDPREEGEAA